MEDTPLMIFATLAWTLSNCLRTDLEAGVKTEELFSNTGLVDDVYMSFGICSLICSRTAFNYLYFFNGFLSTVLDMISES